MCTQFMGYTVHKYYYFFMASKAHHLNCFPTGSNYIYIYMFVSLVRVCVVYVVKEVASFRGDSVN